MGLKTQNHHGFQVFIGLTSSCVSCLKALRHKGIEVILIQLILQPQIISNHCNKFAIRGFTAVVLDGVAEVGVEGIDVAPVPRDLDGVTDGTLDAACGGLIFLCDRGVENFGDTVDYIRVLDGQEDRGAEILVALDVCRYAYLMYYACDLRLDVGGVAVGVGLCHFCALIGF